MAVQSSTVHLVSTTPAANEIKVYYNPIQTGTVPVEVRAVIPGKTYNAGDASTYEVIQSYTLQAAPGELVSLEASQMPDLIGLGFTKNAGLSKLTATQGAGDSIIMVYDDVRFVVTITNDRDTEEVVVKNVLGRTSTILPPYKKGYTATSYSIDGGVNKISIDNTFAGYDAIADTQICFYYETVYVELKFGDLTVFVTIAATGLPASDAIVTATLDGVELPPQVADAQGKVVYTDFGVYDIQVKYGNYKIAFAAATLTKENAIQTVHVALGRNVTVDDNNNAGNSSGVTSANLTIRCVDENGKSIFEQTLTTVVGKTETVKAPPVNGYELEDGQAASQSISIKTGENVVTFRYVTSVADDQNKEDLPRPPVSEKIRSLLEVDEHLSYIQGYPDGTIKPDNKVTRAEVAMIFWRLLKNSDKNVPADEMFTDVGGNEWYSQPINCLAELGIMVGYEDGSFRPKQGITRAEFSTMVSRFDNLQSSSSNPFDDVKEDHWARDYIISSYMKGWISGYPGNTFLPDNNITRAEAVKIINYMLGRGIKKDDVPVELHTLYSDLPTSHWAFAEMIEASVGHDYARGLDGYEKYTEFTLQG